MLEMLLSSAIEVDLEGEARMLEMLLSSAIEVVSKPMDDLV